jgi:RNA polymerase sigma-70 factor (ECF subfamily)
MVDIEQVLTEFRPVLGRTAAMFAPPGSERDDLLQEIYLALLSALPGYRGESSLRTYVLRVAHNCGVRRIASRRNAATPLDEGDHASPAPGPDREAEARQDVERLSTAVRELPLGARQVLVLTLEGLSQREIGQVLGIEENVVSVRLHRARSVLRERSSDAPKARGAGHG